MVVPSKKKTPCEVGKIIWDIVNDPNMIHCSEGRKLACSEISKAVGRSYSYIHQITLGYITKLDGKALDGIIKGLEELADYYPIPQEKIDDIRRIKEQMPERSDKELSLVGKILNRVLAQGFRSNDPEKNKRKLRKTDIAEAAGFSISYISHITSGVSETGKKVSKENAASIANALRELQAEYGITQTFIDRLQDIASGTIVEDGRHVKRLRSADKRRGEYYPTL